MQSDEKKGREGEREKEERREAEDEQKKQEKRELLGEEKERRREAADIEKRERGREILELKRGEDAGERRGEEDEGGKRKRGEEDEEKRKRGEEDVENRRRGEEDEEKRRSGGEDDEEKTRRGEDDTSTGIGSTDSECVPPEDCGWECLVVLRDLLTDRSIVEAKREQQRTLQVWRGMNTVEGEQQQRALQVWRGINTVGGQHWGGYPPLWIKDVQETVRRAAWDHFPSLPPEGATQQELHTYLHHIQEVLTGELLRLAPLLREAGLLAAVIDSYHVHTMSQLERLLERELDSDQLFILLRWTLKTYLSTVLAHPDIAADMADVSVLDVMRLGEWLHKAKTKTLDTTQEYVERFLERVLDKEEEEGLSCDPSDEEAFIRIHQDVTQCLGDVSEKAADVSPFMKRDVNTVCLIQLYSFTLRFAVLEVKRRKRMRCAEDGKITNLFRTLSCATSRGKNRKGGNVKERNIIHLFRTIRTCKEVRKFVLQLASEAHDDAHSTLGFLQELHERTTDELIHIAARNLEVCLQVYFRREGVCLGEELSKDTKVLFSYLAREPDIHPFCLKGVYTQVVSLYLKHLLLSNQSQLERRWGQVGTVIRADAEVIHKLFTQQSEGVVNRSVLLLKVATVLSVTDEETFNSTCRELQQDTHISKEQLNQLILWKDRLSRQQAKAVLDTAPQSLWKRLPTLWTRTSQSAASIV